MKYIVILILSFGDGDYLAMPLPDLGQKDWAECQSIGFSATEYAKALAEEAGKATTTVPLPDGTKQEVTASGWSCTPAEWYKGKGAE